MTVATAPPDIPKDIPQTPGFAIVPNGVLRDPALSMAARLLFAVLDGRRAANSRDRGIRVGAATLAADLGVSESTVKRAAAELTEAGWLERRRTGRTNSWRLTNPARTGKRVTPIQPPLEESSGNPRESRESGGSTGPGSLGTTGTDPATTPPPVTSEPSDRSPVTVLQSITREKYNNTDDLVPAGLSGQPRDEHHRGNGSGKTDHDGETARAKTAKADSTQSGGDGKTARARTAGGSAAAYLSEINAATGANLVMTRPMRELLQRIADNGIPANEAALTASAWLAAKGSRINHPDGFLASIVLPSMADGQQLEEPGQQATPIPPAYKDITEAPTCDHGAAIGACALCRQEQEQPMNPMLQAVLDRLEEPASGYSQGMTLERLPGESRVDYMRREHQHRLELARTHV